MIEYLYVEMVDLLPYLIPPFALKRHSERFPMQQISKH